MVLMLKAFMLIVIRFNQLWFWQNLSDKWEFLEDLLISRGQVKTNGHKARGTHSFSVSTRRKTCILSTVLILNTRFFTVLKSWLFSVDLMNTTICIACKFNLATTICQKSSHIFHRMSHQVLRLQNQQSFPHTATFCSRSNSSRAATLLN